MILNIANSIGTTGNLRGVAKTPIAAAFAPKWAVSLGAVVIHDKLVGLVGIRGALLLLNIDVP